MKKDKPAPVVGAKEDANPEKLEHQRTVGRNREQYSLRGPTVLAPIYANSDAEIDQISTKIGVKTVKKRVKPGKERYERLENEPIRI